MLDLDLSDPANQVRAIIGDLDGSYISDANITFLLTKNSNDVTLTSLECLDYILAQVSYYVREEAGDVEVYWSDLYNQLSNRKDNIEKTTLYSRSKSLFKIGGTTKSEVERVKEDPESQGIGVRRSDFSSLLVSYGIDPENPYFLETK